MREDEERKIITVDKLFCFSLSEREIEKISS